MDKLIINNGSLSIYGLFVIALIILKLSNVINWSWWIILLPIWGPLIIFTIALIVIGFIVYMNVR